MRVIAGKARRLQLKTVPGLGTRPTTDRIKETLFNIINNDLYDTNFLDLFLLFNRGVLQIFGVQKYEVFQNMIEFSPVRYRMFRGSSGLN